jgi:hypothetical protein
MVAAYIAADVLNSNAIDAAAGELLRFAPVGKGDNWSAPTDGTRTVVECVGTFLDGHVRTTFLDGDRRNSAFDGRVSAQTAFASVARSNFAAGNEPRKDDIITTIDQSPQRQFVIVNVFPDGSARWALPLVAK